ncbi:vascular endothelial growth factor receptor 2-like, partial [Paramuricea clavata]
MTDVSSKLVCKVDEANPSPTVEWRYSDDNERTWYLVTPNLGFGEDTFTWKALNETSRPIGDQVVITLISSPYVAIWVSSANMSGFAPAFKHFVNIYASKKPTTSYLTVVIVISCVVAVLVLCFVVIMYRRKKALGGFYICTLPPYRDYIKILDQSKFIHEQTHKLPYISEWEFPRGNIALQDELGSGAFGVVYFAHASGIANFLTRRSTLKDNKSQRRFSFTRLKKRNFSLSTNYCDVVNTAVKTLKVDYSENDLLDIISELKILIHVGEHENVLRILGACTKVTNNEAPLIILEYCPHGNLREFLRTRRDVYEPEWKDVDNVRLSITDLADFSLHISKGMEFLISRKCIHRDLAARNVLIGDGYVAKISDFGLARDVYDSLEYVKVTPGLLPIKWMAIEAIEDRIFNEKTDVWSYGIVLWEMFTLGGTPYPDLDPSKSKHCPRVRISTFRAKALRLNLRKYLPGINRSQVVADLCKLEEWQDRWQMEFNSTKCKVMCITTKKNIIKKQYMFCGQILEEVENHPYLGVMFDNKMKWSSHISNTTRKANVILHVIKRNLWNCPRDVKEVAYKSLVRPTLEYASTAWDPYYKKDVAAVERVQRSAARF